MDAEKPRLFLKDRESWELMKEIRDKITKKAFREALQVSVTQLGRYCQGPACQDRQKNPLDRLKLLIEFIRDANELELAIETLNYLSHPIGYRVRPINRPTPDKDTIEAECLDDYPEKTKLDGLIELRASPSQIRRQCEICKDELEQTVVKYEEVYEDETLRSGRHPLTG